MQDILDMNEVDFHVCSWHCYRTVQQLCCVVQDNLFQKTWNCSSHFRILVIIEEQFLRTPFHRRSNQMTSIIRLLLANEVTHVIRTTDVMKLLVCNFEFELILLFIDSLKTTTYHSSKEHNLYTTSKLVRI